NTTPQTLPLTNNIKQPLHPNPQPITIQLSTHPFPLPPLTPLHFHLPIFSNFTQHHLHFHPTIQPYPHPKSLLFTHLRQHFSKQKYLLLN
ncbi:Mur ligase family protein, partial [Staphylococcus epidermidis]|uniref:Mur ligase family protein n=1 Tax=Staphylococcus epidermidis TaxID=1282 RepID=UPI0037DA180B